MLRSLIFQIAYYAVSAFFVLTSLPLALLPGHKIMCSWIQLYTRVMVGLMRRVGGIDVNVSGKENLPDGPFIIAAKHQSWGDGFVVFSQIKNLAFVTGDHLLKFPFLGTVLRKLGAIVVNNCGGAHARGRLVAEEVENARESGRPILIYPEGHLSPVGTHHRYRKGVFHLYQSYGVPVVPVATDLGLRWPQQSKALRPGPAHVEFLPPLQPGLDKDRFMADLESMIETRCLSMLADQEAAGTMPPGLAAPAVSTLTDVGATQ